MPPLPPHSHKEQGEHNINRRKLGKLLKADPIADTFRADIQRTIVATSSSPLDHDAGSKKLQLVGILATTSKPSEMYAEFTRKTCSELGVEFVLRRIGAAATERTDDSDVEGQGAVEDAIVEANTDENVAGIMVCVTSISILVIDLKI
jgi:methylenetetrahydrofolate dehydrogenase (NAD+)